MKSKIEIFTTGQLTETVTTNSNTSYAKTFIIKYDAPVGNAVKTLLDNELFGGVNYYKSVNAGTDLQLGQVASAQVSFTTTCSSITTSQCFKFWTLQECDSTWRLIGIYFVDSITKDRNKYTVIGYDCVHNLDRDISAYLTNSTDTRLTELYQGICKECHISTGTTVFYPSLANSNTNMTVNPKSLATAGITARTVMGYIAEATGSYIYTRDDNALHCWTYDTVATSLTADDYVNLDMANEPAPTVSGVVVQMANGQCTVGSTDQAMNLIYNPLFYNQTSSITNEVTKIYNIVHSFGQYYPCKFSCFSDMKLKPGNIITVNGNKVIIMSMRLTQSGCEFECTGNPTREPLVQQNTDRITNLEANKDNSNYLTQDWLATNGNKIFNSTITVNDVYIPSGLGYLNNPACTSLVEVIQALLTKNKINPSSSTVNLNMTSTAGPYHTYTTPAYDQSWAVSTSGSVSYVGNVITCTGTTNGSVVFTKTITYPDQTSRVVTYTYNINCYSYIVTHGLDFFLDYVGEQGYGNVAYRVKYGTQTVVNYTANTDVDNTYISVECDVTAGLRIVFKQTGTYTFEKGDTVHAFPEQTYKILSV